MTVLKVIMSIAALALVIFGFYVRHEYKKGKWINGEDLESRKQSRIEALLAFGCFVAAMALLVGVVSL